MCIGFFYVAGLLIFLPCLPIGSYVVIDPYQVERPGADRHPRAPIRRALVRMYRAASGTGCRCGARQVGRPTCRGQWVLTLGQVGSLMTFVLPCRLLRMYDLSDLGAASWAHLRFAVFVMCTLEEVASFTIRSPPFGGTRFVCGRSPNETELSLSMASG